MTKVVVEYIIDLGRTTTNRIVGTQVVIQESHLMYSLLAAEIVQSELNDRRAQPRILSTSYLLTSGVVLRDTSTSSKREKEKKCQDYFPPLYLAEP